MKCSEAFWMMGSTVVEPLMVTDSAAEAGATAQSVSRALRMTFLIFMIRLLVSSDGSFRPDSMELRKVLLRQYIPDVNFLFQFNMAAIHDIFIRM